MHIILRYKIQEQEIYNKSVINSVTIRSYTYGRLLGNVRHLDFNYGYKRLLAVFGVTERINRWIGEK